MTAKAAGAPTSLHELYERARVDLATKDGTALLRWVFWHARAVGRLEIARGVLKRVEGDDYEARIRAMAALPSEAMKAAWEAQRPAVTALDNAQTAVVEAAAYEQAARDVIELLKARR